MRAAKFIYLSTSYLLPLLTMNSTFYEFNPYACLHHSPLWNFVCIPSPLMLSKMLCSMIKVDETGRFLHTFKYTKIKKDLILVLTANLNSLIRN